MLFLLIDTATATGRVILAHYDNGSHAGASGGEPPHADRLGEESLETREFSRQLIPAIGRLLQKNRSKPRDLDALAVVSGPGSFTGLRIGLAAVKALAEATAKPVIAVSRLAMMVSSATARRPEATGIAKDGMVHATLDAGRGTFSHGIYRNAGRTRVSESFETVGELTESLIQHPGPVIASEPSVLEILRGIHGIAPLAIPEVSLREALPLVLHAWQAQDFADIALLDAQYLRRMNPGIEPQAERPLHISKS